MVAIPSSSMAMMKVSRNCPRGIIGRIDGVPLGSTGFDEVLPGSTGSTGSAGFDWVLPGSAGSAGFIRLRQGPIGSGDQRLPTVAPASTPGIVIAWGSDGRAANDVNCSSG